MRSPRHCASTPPRPRDRAFESEDGANIGQNIDLLDLPNLVSKLDDIDGEEKGEHRQGPEEAGDARVETERSLLDLWRDEKSWS